MSANVSRAWIRELSGDIDACRLARWEAAAAAAHWGGDVLTMLRIGTTDLEAIVRHATIAAHLGRIALGEGA